MYTHICMHIINRKHMQFLHREITAKHKLRKNPHLLSPRPAYSRSCSRVVEHSNTARTEPAEKRRNRSYQKIGKAIHINGKSNIGKGSCGFA